MTRCITRLDLFIRLAVGILFAFTSYPVFSVSGSPLPFDAFTANSGEISVPCADWTNAQGLVISVTCGEPLLSDGMLQREVNVTSVDPTYNGTYIQFIMTEPGATGDGQAAPFSTERGSLNFSNVDFIKMNNRDGGIASRLKIIDSQFDDPTKIEDRFVYESTYNYGWANGTGLADPWVDINQEFSSLQYSTDLLTATEIFNTTVGIISDADNFTNDMKLSVDQRLQLGGLPGDQVQKFKHAKVSGGYNNSESDYFGLVNVNPLLPGGTNGGVLNWLPTDILTATWVGVTSNDPLDTLFGVTQYKNLSGTTGSAETKVVSFTSPEAGGGLYSYAAGPIPELNTILQALDGQPLMNTILNSLGGSVYEPLFGPAEAMAGITTVSSTDFSVLTPIPLIGAANLDYIANSDPTPPALQTVDFVPTYDQWSVENGVFSGVACPIVADSCGPPIVNENGMYQRLISVAGVDYYQTLMVADGTVSGDPTTADFIDTGNPLTAALAFKSETYVRVNTGSGPNAGLASQLHLASQDLGYLGNPASNNLPGNAGEFVYDTVMNTGWANSGGFDPRLALTQKVTVPDNILIDTSSTEEIFTMKLGQTQADKFMTLSSRVGTREGGDGFTQPVNTHTVIASGDYQPTTRVAVIDPFDPQYDPLLPTAGKDLGWSAGDALQATWFGGQYSTSAAVATIIASTSYSNLSSGERISSTSLVSTNPDGWLTDPFGPAPVYP